jgi:hypothetical protein
MMHLDLSTSHLVALAAVAAAALLFGYLIGHWRHERHGETEHARGWDGGAAAEAGRWEELTGSTFEELLAVFEEDQRIEAEGAAERTALWEATGPLTSWAPRQPDQVAADEWAGLEREQRGDSGPPSTEDLLAEARRQGYTGEQPVTVGAAEPDTGRWDSSIDPYAHLYKADSSSDLIADQMRRPYRWTGDPASIPPVPVTAPAQQRWPSLPDLAAWADHGRDIAVPSTAPEQWPWAPEEAPAAETVVLAVVTNAGEEAPAWVPVAAAECAAQDADAARFIAEMDADMTVHRAQVRAARVPLMLP